MKNHCPLCGRELGTVNVDRHHLVPRSLKGKDTVVLHRVCHQKIHATFTERELAQRFNTIEKIKENEHIAAFIRWVSRKPPEFYDGNKETADRKRKRRR